MKPLQTLFIFLILITGTISFSQSHSQLMGTWECTSVHSSGKTIPQQSLDEMYLHRIYEFTSPNKVLEYHVDMKNQYYTKGTFLLEGNSLSFPSSNMFFKTPKGKTTTMECVNNYEGKDYNSCLLTVEIVKFTTSSVQYLLKGTSNTEIPEDIYLTFTRK